jgi:hypothetical protein
MMSEISRPKNRRGFDDSKNRYDYAIEKQKELLIEDYKREYKFRITFCLIFGPLLMILGIIGTILFFALEWIEDYPEGLFLPFIAFFIGFFLIYYRDPKELDIFFR